MVDYHDIYSRHATQYDWLVSREDYLGNILPALAAIRPLAGLDVVELGAGTGRLTSQLAPIAKKVLALDNSAHMLSAARTRLAEGNCQNWAVALGDNRQLPVAEQVADLAIAGWSLGHLVGWHQKTWREHIGRAVCEMKRVLRPGGTAIILETLGTGREAPQPPTEGLAAYYVFLEEEHGFSKTWIRTDYRFASLAEAESLTCFFFGQDLADRVVRQGLAILPECTGIWWLKLPG